jgi:predicted tellurium resistance membrane protein TerC
VTAAIAISALALVAFAAEQGVFELVFGTGPRLYLAHALTSLITAVPYVPLYIAFSLIANPERPLVAIPETQLALPSLPQSPPPSSAA